MASDMRAIQPESLYRLYLESEQRPDGRRLDQARPTVLNRDGVGTADGSAYCRLGHSAVLCGIKAEIATPACDAPPGRGWLVPNLELPPLCHHRCRPGPPSEAAQVASAQLQQMLQTSGALDLTALCIEPGRAVWTLYCDVVCLSHDGNVLEAAVLAASAALAGLTLPATRWDAAGERVLVSRTAPRSPLALGALPLAATVAAFDGETLVLDPAGEEEQLATASVTIAWVGDRMTHVHKAGGAQLSQAAMDRCIELTRRRTLELEKLLHN